jgi:hypothetical protein
VRLTDRNTAGFSIFCEVAVELCIVLCGAIFVDIVVEVDTLKSRFAENVKHIFDTVSIVDSDHICGK